MTAESEQGPGEMRVIVITHGDAKYREHMPEPRPLNEVGCIQSRLAGERLKQLKYDSRPTHIVSSRVHRCRQTAELVASALGFPGFPITNADVLEQPVPAEKGRAALQEALASAEGTNVIVCGHGDMANCFRGQIIKNGLEAQDERYFLRGPAIVVFHGPRDGKWKIDAVEILKKDWNDAVKILKEDPAEIWQDVKKP